MSASLSPSLSLSISLLLCSSLSLPPICLPWLSLTPSLSVYLLLSLSRSLALMCSLKHTLCLTFPFPSPFPSLSPPYIFRHLQPIHPVVPLSVVLTPRNLTKIALSFSHLSHSLSLSVFLSPVLSQLPLSVFSVTYSITLQWFLFGSSAHSSELHKDSCITPPLHLHLYWGLNRGWKQNVGLTF